MQRPLSERKNSGKIGIMKQINYICPNKANSHNTRYHPKAKPDEKQHQPQQYIFCPTMAISSPDIPHRPLPVRYTGSGTRCPDRNDLE